MRDEEVPSPTPQGDGEKKSLPHGEPGGEPIAYDLIADAANSGY